jgi:adenylate cyclase
MIFAIMGSLLGLGAGYISTLMDDAGGFEAIFTTIYGAALGIILGFQFGFLEEFIWQPLTRKVGFLYFSILQFFTYLGLIILWLIIVISLGHVINTDQRFYESMQWYLNEEDFIRDVIFANLMTMLLIVIGKLRMLHSSKQLLGFFTGQYYYPEQEVRVIMFVDLIGSTTLAEQLGPLTFSKFLQDCFSDISESIYAWHGEVYQYVGDGIVVSWRGKSRDCSFNSICCYFNISKKIEERMEYYSSSYNSIPRFRAGIHKGEVIITWVGDKKKELAFHGDTINSAARIQSMCKVYDAECLVSGILMNGVSLPKDIKSDSIGDVVPRGKLSSITLFSLSEVA